MLAATADVTGVQFATDDSLESRSAEIFDDLLTPEQTATVLRVNRASIYRLLRNQELPRVKFLSRTYVAMEDLRRLKKAAIESARAEVARSARKTPRPRRAS